MPSPAWFHKETSSPVTQIVLSFRTLSISRSAIRWQHAEQKKLCMTCKAGDIIKRKSAHIFVLIPQSRDEFCIQSIFPREKISLMNSSRVPGGNGVREKSWRIFRENSSLIESVPEGRNSQMRSRIISWQFYNFSSNVWNL